MEIGIIGKGKMGRDIFNHLFQFDERLVLICRKLEDVEALRASIEKQLKKMFTRGYITEAAYEKKKISFTVSNELSALKYCDLVIESVFEDKELKQEIFQTLETIVKSDCILATNTSSIPLNIVFEKCSIKDRCLGMHFFFPVKITRTVEINKTKMTGQKHVETVKDLLARAEKNSLELKEEANMILTRMFTTVITQIYRIYEENYLAIEEIDKVLKESLVTYGLFEIIDSTGMDIILESIGNFINDRYRNLYTPLYNKGRNLLEEGYRGGTGNKGLTAYEQEHAIALKEANEAEVLQYKQNIILRMQSLIINELAFIVNNQYVEKDKINEAVQEVFGLSEAPADILNRIGKQKIAECLLESCRSLKDDIYQPEDLSVYN